MSVELNLRRVKAYRELAGRVHLHDVPGQPTVKQAMAPWLFEFIEQVVCAVYLDGKTLRTRVSEALALVSKKNGKSSGCAWLVIAWSVLQPRQGSKIALVSAEQQAVDVLFRACAGMIRCSPGIAEEFTVTDYRKSITHKKSQTAIEVKAFSPGALQGGLFSLVVIDELSLVGRMPDSIAIFQEASGAVSIGERCVVMLSTHDTRPPEGLFKAKLDQFRAAQLDPVPGLLPCLYEAPAAVRELDLEQLLTQPDILWRTIESTNPSIGYSIPSLDDLRQSFAKTVPQGIEAIGSWLAKHGNIQVLDFMQSGRPWAWAEFLDQCLTDEITTWRDVVTDDATRVYFAADGGGSDDLCGIAVVAALPDGRLRAWSHAAAYPAALKDKRSASFLQDCIAAGELTAWPAHAELSELERLMLDVFSVAKDRLVLVLDNGSRATLNSPALLQRLFDAGLPEEAVFKAPRGTATFAGAEELGRRMAAGPDRIQIGRSELLRWSVANVQISNKGWAEKAADYRKIDSWAALVFACHAHLSCKPLSAPLFSVI